MRDSGADQHGVSARARRTATRLAGVFLKDCWWLQPPARARHAARRQVRGEMGPAGLRWLHVNVRVQHAALHTSPTTANRCNRRIVLYAATRARPAT